MPGIAPQYAPPRPTPLEAIRKELAEQRGTLEEHGKALAEVVNVQGYMRGQLDVLVNRSSSRPPKSTISAKTVGATVGGVAAAAAAAWGALQASGVLH